MRRLARDQEGYAVPMVMGALLLMLAIAALAVQESVSFSVTSNRDRNSKAALAAAQAGVQAARLRIASVGPQDTMCVSPPGVTPSESTPVGGNCPTSSQGRIGTDATYEYYATPALASSDTSCAGAFIGAGSASPKQRCVTSTGIAYGVKRRVQVRVASTASKLNPVDGIFGLNGVTVGNRASISATVGSNGPIVVRGAGSSVDRVELGPGGTYSGPAPASPIVRNTNAFSLTPVDIGNTATVNNNLAIPALSGYSAVNRNMVLTSDIVLPGGDYNFCHLDLGSGGIDAMPGQTVRIFVDAPDAVRPGSGCPSGSPWGLLEGRNGINLGMKTGASPADLQIYVYGWPKTGSYAGSNGNGANVVDVARNNLNARAFIYAPQSRVDVANNNASLDPGAVVGEEIVVKNNLTFTWDPSLALVGYGDYSRRDWRECRSDPSDPADPESGCS